MLLLVVACSAFNFPTTSSRCLLPKDLLRGVRYTSCILYHDLGSKLTGVSGVDEGGTLGTGPYAPKNTLVISEWTIIIHMVTSLHFFQAEG